ncbi:MAG: hypothetical protein FWB84_04250 [Candidatus Bathyarchaeota archaeon]|uniref:hypothetical protein n=1 Tax=Candidatus Bathycorpusculum sp. TaxID=2994959 RepID=UPI00283A30D5|nr:hypothetical protein [Candidatus Termiticorpusculum sp.]MCL2257381.1 hypothetical protein [Candidatus Termiticorpusculum sp.]MCL2292520.1 hypothetical protein [Candidatus Termiticorpusculum sp.]
MSYSLRSGSRRNAGSKVQKSVNQKKAALKKNKANAKYLNTESVEQTLQDNVGKTLASIERLGNQVFALSPFSQYYDDWLINLRQVVSEFEAFPEVTIDETFVKEREQAFLDIELALTEYKTQEDNIAEAEKTIYTINQELRVLEATYTENSRTLNNKHNTDAQQITKQIKTLEEDIANQENLKFGVFQFGAKKVAAQKLEQTQQTLTTTKKQLETIKQNFTTQHNQLYESYTAKKQELTTKTETLQKTLTQTETDTSTETRKKICTNLNNTINKLITRQPITTTTPTTDPSN